MNKEESSTVPSIEIPREFKEKYPYEFSTPAQSESHEHDSRESRMTGDRLFTSTPFTYTSEFPSSDLPPRRVGESDFFDTTTFRTYNSAEEKPKQTKSKFASRSFVDKESAMDKSTSAEVFSSTPVFEHESKESTSAESTGKFTGPRVNVRTQETSTRMSSGLKYPSSSESRENDRSSEESKFRVYTKPTPFVPLKAKRSLSYNPQIRTFETETDFVKPTVFIKPHTRIIEQETDFVKPHVFYKPETRLIERETDFVKPSVFYKPHTRIIERESDFVKPSVFYKPHTRIIEREADFVKPRVFYKPHTRIIERETDFVKPHFRLIETESDLVKHYGY
jgi:2-keto-4-pentenoate hydratase/2-oxohepta-3-ene-1,7-dioic acid hydratase in catechol pathway